jgi:predicted  nucleic acid-binding Zn-ribbon protein
LQVENLKAKLDDLQTSMAEQETTIEVLRAELNKKHEQLGFITDEKVKTSFGAFLYIAFRMQMKFFLDLQNLKQKLPDLEILRIE